MLIIIVIIIIIFIIIVYGNKQAEFVVSVRVVGEVLRRLELVVEQFGNFAVEFVGQREAVLLPRVILHAKRRQARSARLLREVFVRELDVRHKATNVLFHRLRRNILVDCIACNTEHVRPVFSK